MFTIEQLLLYCLPSALLIRLLWLDEVEIGFEGFFVHKHKFVQFPSGHTQRLSWVDYIRQSLFNIYEDFGSDLATLKQHRQGIVRCTFCLSFWVSIPSAIIFVLAVGMPIYTLIPMYFFIVAINAILSNWM